MEGGYDEHNRSILSQSYMQGVQRLSGNLNTTNEAHEIAEEKIKSREKSWSWLFKKFSKIPDLGLLNILTLEPDNESDGSETSEVKFPVRKSAAELQHWINTGNPPWQALEFEGNNTDEYVSLSESETGDLEESRSLHSTSMIVDQMKPANSREHLIATGSSNSSVDTATYIRETGNSGKKKEKEGLGNSDNNRDNNIVGRSMSAAVPKALPENLEAMDVDTELDKESRIFIRDEITSGKRTANETNQASEIKSKDYEVKDSEVTFESKESGIGSLRVENMEKDKKKTEAKLSSSSEELILGLNQTSPKGRRKLFTKNDTIFDLLSPMVKTKRQISSVRKSFHPALDTPSTSLKFKAKIGPRFLTMPGRKSRNYSILKRNRNKSMLSKSRVSKSNRHSHEKDAQAVNSLDTSTSPDHKNSKTSDVSRDEQTSAKTLASNPNTDNKKGNDSTNKSPGDSSFSLSSKDVSLIMNEEWNKTPKEPLPVAQKKNQQLSVEDIQESKNKGNDNDQGSIFKRLSDCSSETKESRMRGMLHVKKNLCATDLRSLGGTDSTATSSSDLFTKNDEDSFSNASTILMPYSRKRNKCSNSLKKNLVKGKLPGFARSQPIVVLHDFLNLKSCCGKLEKENNENWLQKKKKDEKRVHKISPKLNSNEKNAAKTRSRKAKTRKILRKKNLKLRKETTASQDRQKTLITGCDNLDSSMQKVLCLKIKRLEDDHDYCFNTRTSNSQDGKRNVSLPNEENSTITFTNTNHNRWESIFVLPSSDEEDLFKKLNDTSKLRTSRKRKSEDREEIESPTSVAKSVKINNRGGAKCAKTIQDCYIIASSSSEDESKIVSGTAAGKARVAKKYTTRNKRKDSMESKRTTSSGEDEHGDRSESLQIENEKLEKQSSGVNRRSGRKRGKQALETRGDYPVAQRRVNNVTRALRKSREERTCGNSDKYEVKISLDTKDGAGVRSRETNDKGNSPVQKPVDRVLNLKEKPARNFSEKYSRAVRRRNHFLRIQTATDSSDSNDRCEVSRVPDYTDRMKNCSTSSDNNSESSGKNIEKVSSAFRLVLNESSDNDSILTSQPKNNESDDSRGENVLGKNLGIFNIKQTIESRKGSARRSKGGNSLKSVIRLSSRNKSRGVTDVNSKIVFRTKEYWESDSDNL